VNEFLTLPRKVVEQALSTLQHDCDALLQSHQCPVTGAIPAEDEAAVEAFDDYREVIAALRAVLEQRQEPEQEPVATVKVMGSHGGKPALGCLIDLKHEHRVKVGDRLYNHPAPQPVELTDEEVFAASVQAKDAMREHIFEHAVDTYRSLRGVYNIFYARAVIAAYRVKQEGKV
jgi:hypothetical protein